MARSDAGEALLQLEVIKLLLQVAWADLEVHGAEADLILRHSRRLGLPERDLTQLQEYLQGSRPLPPPDLALLRARREDVIAAVKQMIRADDQVTDDEEMVLQLIETTLGV